MIVSYKYNVSNSVSPKNEEPNKDQINAMHIADKPKIVLDYHAMPYTYNNEVFALETDEKI